MKLIYQYFFRGLLTALPIGLTIYVLYIFWKWSETLSQAWLRPFISEEIYFPGMGLIIASWAILLLGYLVSHRGVVKLVSMVEFPFANIPVVKSIYLSLKNFADYFNPAKDDSDQQAVIIKSPHQDLEMVGLVTQQHVENLGNGFSTDDRVAVFLPMGYNIGGYTVFVPRNWVQPIEMSAEEVMRMSLFAWMTTDHNETNLNAEAQDNQSLK
jgi:uncharacterized membrane protein